MLQKLSKKYLKNFKKVLTSDLSSDIMLTVGRTQQALGVPNDNKQEIKIFKKFQKSVDK